VAVPSPVAIRRSRPARTTIWYLLLRMPDDRRLAPGDRECYILLWSLEGAVPPARPHLVLAGSPKPRGHSVGYPNTMIFVVGLIYAGTILFCWEPRHGSCEPGLDGRYWQPERSALHRRRYCIAFECRNWSTGRLGNRDGARPNRIGSGLLQLRYRARRLRQAAAPLSETRRSTVMLYPSPRCRAGRRRTALARLGRGE
jgi:hypothetical protein